MLPLNATIRYRQLDFGIISIHDPYIFFSKRSRVYNVDMHISSSLSRSVCRQLDINPMILRTQPKDKQYVFH